MKIAAISTKVVDAGDRDRIFVRVDTDEPDLIGVADAHPGRSPRPHPAFAPDGGLLDW